MAHGTVKWFNADKGFAFITQDEGPNVFVHYSGIAASDFKLLNEGDQVEFQVTQGPKGPQAQSVTKITTTARQIHRPPPPTQPKIFIDIREYHAVKKDACPHGNVRTPLLLALMILFMSAVEKP